MSRKSKFNSGTFVPGFLDTREAIFQFYGEYNANKYILDDNSEHMIFYHNVTEFIDESIFDPMYMTPKGPGKPAYSPKVLMAFMIYCMSKGVTPVKVIKDLIIDVRMRLAFGLLPQSDVFCYKTFYNFRKKLYEYYLEKGVDLFKECFRKVTLKQVEKFGVIATHVRMDSKYFDSNIQAMSRYVIVLKTLQKVLKEHPFKFSSTLQNEIDKYMREDGEKTIYALKNGKATYTEILTNLGSVVYRAIEELVAYEAVKDSDSEKRESHYSLLYRVFGEQFDIVGNTPVPKDGEEISTGAVQNPNDPEAAFREKNKNIYRGYVVCVTECFNNTAAPNLVLDYNVASANINDQYLYIKGILGSEKSSGQRVLVCSADCAFTSDENSEFNRSHLSNSNHQPAVGSAPVIEQWVGKMGGKVPRYNLFQEGETLRVIDRKTGKEYIAEKYKDKVTRKGESIERWKAVVEKEDGQMVDKLFTRDELEMANRRREIESMPKEKVFCRNNVEATMFQMGYLADGCQTRVRGLYKHNLYIGARVMWMNFRRIFLFLQRKGKLEEQELYMAAS